MAVAAPRVEDGHSPIHLRRQHQRHFVGHSCNNDHQLAVIARQAKHDRVDQLRGRKDRDHGIERVLNIAVDDRGQRHNDRVGYQNDPADADIRKTAIQIAGDDIRAARTAAAEQDQAQTCTRQDSAEHSGDDPLAVIGDRGQLKEVDQQRYHCRGNDRAQDEPPAALYRAPDEQRDIQKQRCNADGSREQVIEHRRDTCHAAGGDLIRGGKIRNRQSVQNSSEEHQEIVHGISFCSVGKIHMITLSYRCYESNRICLTTLTRYSRELLRCMDSVPQIKDLDRISP